MNPYSIPLFSWNDFAAFLEGQDISRTLEDLYRQIHTGLNISLEQINSSSAAAFKNLTDTLTQGEDSVLTEEDAINISSPYTNTAVIVNQNIADLTTQIGNMKEWFLNYKNRALRSIDMDDLVNPDF